MPHYGGANVSHAAITIARLAGCIHLNSNFSPMGYILCMTIMEHRICGLALVLKCMAFYRNPTDTQLDGTCWDFLSSDRAAAVACFGGLFFQSSCEPGAHQILLHKRVELDL